MAAHAKTQIHIVAAHAELQEFDKADDVQGAGASCCDHCSTRS
jgi:hypothetical protein